MAQIREDLRCSGDALVMAASTYQTQDAFDAQQIQMLESQIRADELGNPY